MKEDKRTLLRKKADTFCVLNRLVHITYIKNRVWKNGRIIKVETEYLILEERLEGEVIIFFDEIKDIRQYAEEIRL